MKKPICGPMPATRDLKSKNRRKCPIQVQFHIGAVGYFYNQITGDSGAGDRMSVGTALVLRVGIDEIVGQAEHHRSLDSRFLIEIGVTNTSIHRPMAKSKSRQSVQLIGT